MWSDHLRNIMTVVTVISCLTLIVESISLPECEEGKWRCGNGVCITHETVCDGVNHCPRGEDERHCKDSTHVTTENVNGTNCAESQFECDNGHCIPDSWVCDQYADCYYGEDEADCVYSTEFPRTTPGPSSCYTPFELVGGRCVFVDPITSASWYEARYVCGIFGGDLVIFDSINFFSDLVEYINKKGLITKEYWVGASDFSGGWMWLSGAKVKMGTPLWALYGLGSNNYNQEPGGSENKKKINHPEVLTKISPKDSFCAYLDMKRFFYMDDYDCYGTKSFICQIPTWKASNTEAMAIPKETGLTEERVKEILAAFETGKH